MELDQPIRDLPAQVIPRHVDDVATCTFGESRILATERGNTPVALDAVSAVVWDGCDGSSTVGDLAEDLHAALGGDPGERRELVSWLISSLAIHGLVDWEDADVVLMPRRLHQSVTAEDCTGQTLGVRDAVFVQVRDSFGRSIRVGATIPWLIEGLGLVEGLEFEPVDDQAREFWFLRGSQSTAGNARAQVLFDGLGNRHHLSWSMEMAAETLWRTIAGAVAGPPAVSLEGPVLATARGAVLVHPTLREMVIDAVRPLRGPGRPPLLPSVILGLRGTEVELPGPNSWSIPVVGILMPDFDDEITRFRHLLHLARHWDDAHLEGILQLFRSIEFIAVPHSVELDDLRNRLAVELC